MALKRQGGTGTERLYAHVCAVCYVYALLCCLDPFPPLLVYSIRM